MIVLVADARTQRAELDRRISAFDAEFVRPLGERERRGSSVEALVVVHRWSSVRVRGCSRWNSADGPPETSNRYATPAKPGGFPVAQAANRFTTR
jgi:hypothetical protein